MTSPWEAVLGEQFASLHPTLQAYFAEIPEGSTGVGRGVFDVVGTPRVWLWPVLTVLGREGVLFAAWRRRVPFTVLNHPVVDYDGNPAVLAHRLFHFRVGDRRMEDAVTATRRGLVDHLGFTRRFVARLSVSVVDGALHLESTAIAVRFGRFRLWVPRRWAPVVRLVERIDGRNGRQHVALVVESPKVGRLYEYRGFFDYAVLAGEHHG